MKNGYSTLHRLNIEVRADFLEIVAGFQDGRRTARELRYALDNTNVGNAEDLRWLACIIERRLDEIGEKS